MHMATIRLQMTSGHDVYFRAPRHEIRQLVLSRHGQSIAPNDELVVTTERNIPITIRLQEINKIHIM